MLPEFEFHHIGVAVCNIDATAQIYAKAGYSRSQTVFDPLQKVRVCWLTRDGSPTIELLEPVDDNSPISATLKKNGVTPYHLCYAVPDLDAATAALRAIHYAMVARPQPAVAIGGSRVAFFFHKDTGLIELVEPPALIVT
ncbi:MAG: VOC family protein [Bacteroidales bacterium]|nr:VOC family protein [Bacteroidales bacterium]